MTNSSHLIKTLTATFNLPLRGREIPAWRGAFIALAGMENDLFHNHDNSSTVRQFDSLAVMKLEQNTTVNGHRPIANGHPKMNSGQNLPVATAETGELRTAEPKTEKFLYRYPLVQYRSIRGKAAIFAMNEGVAAFQKVLATSNWEINWEGQPLQLQLEGLDMKDHYLQVTKEMHSYRLRRWMPFNDANYQRWLDCPDLHAKVDLLESILPGQLLNFCTGVGWQLPQRFDFRLLDLHATHSLRYHDIRRIALDVTYSANLLLPFGMALGKAVSHGFGCQYPLKKRDNV